MTNEALPLAWRVDGLGKGEDSEDGAGREREKSTRGDSESSEQEERARVDSGRGGREKRAREEREGRRRARWGSARWERERKRDGEVAPAAGLRRACGGPGRGGLWADEHGRAGWERGPPSGAPAVSRESASRPFDHLAQARRMQRGQRSHGLAPRRRCDSRAAGEARSRAHDGEHIDMSLREHLRGKGRGRGGGQTLRIVGPSHYGWYPVTDPNGLYNGVKLVSARRQIRVHVGGPGRARRHRHGDSESGLRAWLEDSGVGQ